MTPEKQNEQPAAPTQRITPRALLETQRISDPHIHPGGQRVAFVVTVPDFDDSTMISHLWLTEWGTEAEEDAETADSDGAADDNSEERDVTASVTVPDAIAPMETEAPAATAPAETQMPAATDADTPAPDAPDYTRQLTYSREGEHNPRWSPDGRYLAFLSSRPDPAASEEDDDDEQTEQVWILPGDGGEARKITSAKEGILEFHWMPDSASLLYLAPEPRPRPLESVRKDDRDRRKIDPTVEHDELLRRQISRMEIEEGKPKLLYTGDLGLHDFVVSPDGTRICFATNYSGEDNDYHVTDVYVRPLESGVPVKLVRRGGGKYHLRWSPDGKQVAFLSWHDPALSYSRETLYAANVPDELPENSPYGPDAPGIAECRALTTLDTDLAAFEWSHTERGGMYAVAAAGTGSEIYHIGAETVKIELEGRVERGELALHPESDELVWVQESATALPELYVREADGNVVPITKLNADFATAYRLPRQEVVSWQSTEGMTIEGVLLYPLDYEPGKRYPLVVQIHGGPKGRSHDTLRNYYLAPVWSAEGYVVLQPNFRGSEGYGHAFAIANRRDLGGGDFRDIMAGVDWCIAQGLADPQRLGIMGGSYGGYMTNWAIGHTDRFRAAVSMFGIFHLQTDYSNSELSRWDNEYMGAYYWEDPEIYRRLSPGSYIEHIKTPTLILHGDDDSNTFISNSKELYQALRHRGVTTQFVHYPREGHGLREPNHRMDEVRRALAWMDRFLRNTNGTQGVYHIGDVVQHPEGRLELRVTKAEVAAFATWQEADEAAALLEIALTVSQKDTTETLAPLTLHFAELRLEMGTGQEALLPVGVPLEVPGGKVLLQGENLRLAQRPDPDTQQFAFGAAAVFRVPKAAGEGRLRVADFPPVTLLWSADDE